MGGPQLDAKAIMATAIVTPIPSLPSVVPEEREDKLRAIIANIQQQHPIMRRNIVTESKASFSSSQHPKHSTNGTSSNGDISDRSLDGLFQIMATQHDPNRGDIYRSTITSNQSKSEIDLAIDKANAQRAADAKWTNDSQIDALLRTFDVHTAETLRFYRDALVRALDRRLGKDNPEAKAVMEAQIKLEAELPPKQAAITPKPAAQDSAAPTNSADPRVRPTTQRQGDAAGSQRPQTSDGVHDPARRHSMQTPPSVAGTKRSASTMRSVSEVTPSDSPYLQRRERVSSGQNPSVRGGVSTSRDAYTGHPPRLQTTGFAPGGQGMTRSASDTQQPRQHSNDRWDAAAGAGGNRSAVEPQRASTNIDRDRDPRRSRSRKSMG